jgi:uncharacterized protein (DUF2267 family)
MNYDQFVNTVAQEARIGPEEAARATRATLRTLAERIASGEARDLAAELPPEVAPWLATTTAAEGFDADEFLRRVAEGTDADIATARRYATAVFDALGRAVSDDEYEDMVAELSRDYAPLLPRGQWVEVMTADEFLQRVADRAATDHEGAQRAIEAVLETLAERIAGGEADDLIERLPIELHAPLEKGKAESGGKAKRMSLDEFVDRVAAREGAGPEQALDDARAVLRTLRDAVGDDEFFDVTVQLPGEYREALAFG